MQTKIFLVAVAGTAFASNLQPRQTVDTACLSIIQSVPTPPPSLLSALAPNAAGVTNICALSVPSSLSGEFSSFVSAESSWFQANKDQLTKCSFFNQVKSITALDCKAAGSGTAQTASVTGTNTAATATRTNAAAREGGMAAAVIAAGFALAAL
ncbi:hypothetical protein AAL_02234 [Moelleriella libera RCEF 2490]|uniref:Infection structure specific protein n=1 Tax=Moelleriella libera RCEF 2490 TaxID=1081109 RepID=A0A162IX54_9HYPO|nr:hypothetical protein AAL_02234 [Moelleriella libera RCEF 2490]